MSETPNADLVELASPIGFEATLHRLTEAIEAAGLTVFARIDHSDGARQAGLMMPPTTVLIYGHAKGGTPDHARRTPNRHSICRCACSCAKPARAPWFRFAPIAPVLLQAGVPEDLAHRLDPAQRLLATAIQS